jgi:hypothetical protein
MIEKLVSCEKCDRLLLKTEMKIDDVTHRIYCATCYPVRNIIIHDHSYKPTWDMKGNKLTRLFFGVELEVECRDINDTLRVVNVEKGDRIVKHDGTISHGFEIVSAPCTIRYHQRRFGWYKLCKDLKKIKCTSDNKTCGLHVHMTKNFSKAEELRFSTFMYHHIDFLRVLSRRDENSYAQIPDDIWKRIWEKKEVRGERYEIVNWVNENTVEFRLPKGTLKPEIILATIEFCDAAIFYTRGKSLIQLKKEDITDFITWLCKSGRNNRAKYSHLISFISKNRAAIADPSKRHIKKKKGRPVGSRNRNGDIVHTSSPDMVWRNVPSDGTVEPTGNQEVPGPYPPEERRPSGCGSFAEMLGAYTQRIYAGLGVPAGYAVIPSANEIHVVTPMHHTQNIGVDWAADDDGR